MPNVPRMKLCSSLFIVKSTPSSNTSENLSSQVFVRNVWYSSAQNTTESRGGTRTSMRLISFRVEQLF